MPPPEDPPPEDPPPDDPPPEDPRPQGAPPEAAPREDPPPGWTGRPAGRPDLDDLRPLGFRPGGRARPDPGRTGGILPARSRWRTLALLVLLLVFAAVVLHRHPNACSNHPPSGPNPANAGFWAASAIAAVPCPSTGRAVYGLHDTDHESMAGLDPIADPHGGYLGVYAPAPVSSSGPPPAATQVVLGRSNDLLTWSRVRVLAATTGGAPDPTLQPTPGGGYLLAFRDGQRIQVRFYASLSALLAAGHAASIELPLRLSAVQNGDPSFRSVAWNGGLHRSRLTIAFTYLSGGLERTGIGVLQGFRQWSAQPDTALDQGLDQRGLSGNHGQQRQFTVAGRSWRILAAQELSDSTADTQAGWNIAVDDVAARQVYPIKLGTVSGTLASSFGRPVARVLPAPSGGGHVLVVSVYVFGAGPAHAEAGELLYWNPIGVS